jgi:hypothetical protein
MKEFTRYIFEDRHFSKENNRVKHNAFLPAPDGETSVSNIVSLGEEEIWQLGDEAGKPRRKPAIARGDFNTQDVLSARLILKQSEPPPRHWNIIGWDRNSKDAQKAQAIELAPLSELHIRVIAFD